MPDAEDQNPTDHQWILLPSQLKRKKGGAANVKPIPTTLLAAASPPLYVLNRARVGARNLTEKKQLVTGERAPHQGEEKIAAASRSAEADIQRAANSRVGGLSGMSRSELRDLRKQAAKKIAKGYNEANPPGKRTLVGATVAGSVNLYHAVREREAGETVRHAIGQRLKENIKNAGTQGTSIDSARLARVLIDFNAPLLSGVGLRSQSIYNDRIANASGTPIPDKSQSRADVLMDRTMELRKQHIIQTRDEEKLRQHLELIDAEIQRTRERMNNQPVANLGEDQSRVANLGEKEGGEARGPTYTNDQILEKLNDLKASVALSKFVSKEDLARLAEDESPAVRAAALRNRNLRLSTEEIGERTDKEITAAKASGNTSVLHSLTLNPKISADDLRKIHETGLADSNLKVALAINKNADEKLLLSLAADEDGSVSRAAINELKRRGRTVTTPS